MTSSSSMSGTFSISSTRAWRTMAPIVAASLSVGRTARDRQALGLLELHEPVEVLELGVVEACSHRTSGPPARRPTGPPLPRARRPPASPTARRAPPTPARVGAMRVLTTIDRRTWRAGRCVSGSTPKSGAVGAFQAAAGGGGGTHHDQVGGLRLVQDRRGHAGCPSTMSGRRCSLPCWRTNVVRARSAWARTVGVDVRRHDVEHVHLRAGTRVPARPPRRAPAPRGVRRGPAPGSGAPRRCPAA